MNKGCLFGSTGCPTSVVIQLLELAGVSNPSAFVQIINSGFTIGANTELLPEATDAAYSSVPAVDGKSGDTDFPFGKMKALATVGEYDVCTGTFCFF